MRPSRAAGRRPGLRQTELRPTRTAQRRYHGSPVQGPSPFKKILKVFLCLLALILIFSIMGSVTKNRHNDKQVSEADTQADNLQQENSEVTSEKENSEGEYVSDTSGAAAAEKADSAEPVEVYYYYSLLSDQEKEEYDTILNGLTNREEVIDLSFSYQEARRILALVFEDHPEIFWFDGSCHYEYSENICKLTPNYTLSGEEIDSRQAKLDSSCREILEELADVSSDYTKCRIVFEYLIDTIDYDLNSTENQTICGSLINRTCVCAGYARGAQYLLQKSGVQCIYVTGNITDQGRHSWNIVLCSGNYYQFDATFGDPNFTTWNSEDVEGLPTDLKYQYIYLCCDDTVMLKDHEPDTDPEIPSCTSNDQEYYRMNQLYHEEYNQTIKSNIEGQLDGQGYWLGQFETLSAMNQLLDDLSAGNVSHKAKSIHYLYDDVHYIIKIWE